MIAYCRFDVGKRAHQCTYVSDDGARCEERAWLEIDHIVARAKGGSDEPENLRVRCRSHNQLHAEETFLQRYLGPQEELQRLLASLR